MATMLELHTRQADTTAIKRARKKEKNATKRRQSRSAALGRPAMKLLGGGGGGLQLVCGRPTLALSKSELVVSHIRRNLLSSTFSDLTR